MMSLFLMRLARATPNAVPASGENWTVKTKGGSLFATAKNFPFCVRGTLG